MPPQAAVVVIGTRRSALAMRQTERVVELLSEAWPSVSCDVRPIVTRGDRTQRSGEPLPEIGGKGLFTAELEQGLREGKLDLAVHSLKDLPTEDPPDVTIGAVCRREDARDCLVSRRGELLEELPPGSVVGTSSLRRSAQLLALRPELELRSIRGNVDTRIRKVRDGEYDAVVLAAAGIVRLGLEPEVTEWLSLETMLPAPGQGALAVQCRADDERVLELLAAIEDPLTRAETTAERAFLRELQAGCTAPVAACAHVVEPAPSTPSDNLSHGDTQPLRVRLRGLVLSPDGREVVRVEDEGMPEEVGERLAREALGAGARTILLRVRQGHVQGLTLDMASDDDSNAGTPGESPVRWFVEGQTPDVSEAAKSRPLRGRRIVVTRPRGQAERVAERLEALGATVTVVPLVRIEPVEEPGLEAAARDIGGYDWVVFTSANAVAALHDLGAELGSTRVATVGPATAHAVRKLGVGPALVPDQYAAERIPDALGPVAGLRVLLPQADVADGRLAQELRDRGAHVDAVAAYRTVAVTPPDADLEELRSADVVLLASGSAARSLAANGGSGRGLVVYIGPKTAAVGRKVGLPDGIVADEASSEGIIHALTSHFEEGTEP